MLPRLREKYMNIWRSKWCWCIGGEINISVIAGCNGVVS